MRPKDSPAVDCLTTFEVDYTVQLRLAARDDLDKLEWYGLYTHYRTLYARTYEDQLHGRRLMLLAVVNGFPIGQIFIHLNDAGVEQVYRQRRGYIYSLRVLDPFRGRGIGTRLILQAEQLLRERGYRWVLIAVAKTNHGARTLYERLGYVVFGDDPGRWSYVDHQGRMQRVEEPSWMLQKRL
ncbi:MAG: GNAT family N-acetyltransferase [Anaerolineae bacterium]|nr:GNAT family N-acetyltransferase [Anaerolineae bacterium]